MADIFDQIAGNDTGGGPDIFDHIAGNLPEPTGLEKLGGWASNAVTSLPDSLMNMVFSIPSGIKNLQDLPNNVFNAGYQAGTLLRDSTTGEEISPTGKTKEDYLDLAGGDPLKAQELVKADAASVAGTDSQIDRTFRGIGSIASTFGGAEVLPVLGVGAGPELFNKVLQKIGVDAPTTPEEDAKNLVTNIVQGNTLGAIGKTFGLGSTKTGEAIEPEIISPEVQQIQSLGLDKPSFAKAARKYRATEDGVLPIDQVIQGTTERGVFNGEDPSALAIQGRNNAALGKLGEQVHGENGLLAQADEAIAAKTIAPENVPPESLGWWKSLDEFVNQKNAAEAAGLPQPKPPISLITYPRALAFIAKHPDSAPAFMEQLGKRAAVTDEMFDGTLSSLSKRKSALQGESYDRGSTFSRELDQKISQDLKNTIIQRANEAKPGLGDRVDSLNSDMQEHYILGKQIQSAVDKQAGAPYKAPKATTPPSIIKAAISGGTKGGLLGAGIDLAASLHGLPGPIAAINAVFQGGKAALENPAIAGAASTGLKAIGSVLSSSKIPVGTVAANNKPVTKARLDELMSGVFPSDKKEKNMPVEAPKNVIPYDQLSPKGQKMADDLQAKIPPEILDAVRQVESSGGKNLESHDKDGNVIARGPYGLTDKTGMFYHKELGITDKYDPYDEKQSRLIASAILADELDRFGGDISKALTSYNSGPKNVKENTLGPQGRAYAGKVLSEVNKAKA